ncbi:hypothetical protein EYE40_09105 [Glaciihabitans arcticus]|uniref:Uncharacterized protein n=1 Tax=Glaciihabitans arcticus TaxID=2668039 RepID=A0A4Q9GXQ1_9MICO|nr:hypothetical protein [Glaciihabitans arcticus]TBN57533.1 hypothetical protein EYE40_09105 [Glaciihabitans arcticus]
MADHASEDEFGEVRHRSATVTVPVVARARAGPTATDMMIELWSRERDATVWLYLGDGSDQRLEVTLESAGLLAAALARQLRTAAG